MLSTLLSSQQSGTMSSMQPSLLQTHHNSTLNSNILVLPGSLLLLICIKSTMMVPLLIQRICQALVCSSEIHKVQLLQHSLSGFHVDTMQQKLKLWQQQGHLNLLFDIGIRCSAGRGFYAGCSTISADTISLSLGSLIVDAKSFTSCFNELHYSHTKREGNKVTHSLARHARYVTNYVV